MNWKQFLPYNEELWDKIYESAVSRISTDNITLYGIELSPNAARKAKENVNRFAHRGYDTHPLRGFSRKRPSSGSRQTHIIDEPALAQSAWIKKI